MAADATFVATPKPSQVLISTANTARDGTGTIGTVFTAGANGSEIWWVAVKARGVTTAGMVRLFLHDGTTYRGLLREIPIGAVPSPSATVPTHESVIPFCMPVQGKPTQPLILPVNWSLRAATHNAESFDVIAMGGDY